MEISTITALTRQREGMTLEKFGEALGVTRQAVSQWEQGDVLPDGILLVSIVMKCKGWKSDWAQACIEAHPRYQEFECNNHNPHDKDQPPAACLACEAGEGTA